MWILHAEENILLSLTASFCNNLFCYTYISQNSYITPFPSGIILEDHVVCRIERDYHADVNEEGFGFNRKCFKTDGNVAIAVEMIPDTHFAYDQGWMWMNIL